MKLILPFLLGIILLSSCKTDFSLGGEYKEVPIVHCLLDPHNNYHYLKLNKTFLGDGDATQFAKIPDSSYFQDVDATIYELNKNTDDTIRKWKLKDTIIDNKEPGMFYSPEQKLYYFHTDDDNKLNLSYDIKYFLHIDIDNGNHTVRGETELVKGVNISSPAQQNALRFAPADVSKDGYMVESVGFPTGEGEIFNAKIAFYYREVSPGGDAAIKHFDWNLGTIRKSELTSQTNGSFRAPGERFYQLIQENVPINNDLLRREVRRIEITLTAGSEDLSIYMLANQPTSTLTQNKPEFTNISGGLGIFSARTTMVQVKQAFNPPLSRALNNNSTRELVEGPYTVQLGFCSHLNMDQDQSYYCW